MSGTEVTTVNRHINGKIGLVVLAAELAELIFALMIDGPSQGTKELFSFYA